MQKKWRNATKKYRNVDINLLKISYMDLKPLPYTCEVPIGKGQDSNEKHNGASVKKSLMERLK